MIKKMLKINLFIVALALQGCAYEYCCFDENEGFDLDNDCYRFRAVCEVMCGGDCLGAPSENWGH